MEATTAKSDPEHVYAEDIEPQTIQCKNIDAQPQLRLNWLQCVRSREMNLSTVDLASKVMIIVDLASKALWARGGAWSYDPSTRATHR